MSPYSLIIVNWNSWDLLSQCLEKLKGQTFRDFTVLVIDNASSQLPPEGFLSRHPNVTLVQNRSNIGFAAANNQAIQVLADAEWVVLLNPDAFPEADWLQHLVDAADDHPGYAMFASRMLMVREREHLMDGDGDAYHLSGLVWREGYGRHLSEAKGLREIFSPCAAAAMYRKDAFVSAGGFDEDFFCYVEDVDLGFRLRLMGHRCLLVPDAVVRHVGSGTSGGRHSDFALYHGHRNLVWTFVKDMPGFLFWLLLPLHLALNFFSLIWFALRGHGGVILRAKRDALSGLPRMWRKRRQIQRHRTASVGDIWRVLDKRLLPVQMIARLLGGASGK